MKICRLSFFALILGLPVGVPAAGGPSVHVRLEPRFGDMPLVCDTETYRTEAAQRISVNRLDFLVAGFALRRQGGGWIGPSDWSAYVSVRDRRTTFEHSTWTLQRPCFLCWVASGGQSCRSRSL